MKDKILYLVVAIAVLFGAAWGLIHQMEKAEAKARVTACLENLRCIGQAIKSYRDQNDGRYPPNLQALYPKYLEDRRGLRCPGYCPDTPTNSDAVSYMYFKADGPISNRQIIVRDAPASHREMHGAAVLFANGEYEWIKEK